MVLNLFHKIVRQTRTSRNNNGLPTQFNRSVAQIAKKNRFSRPARASDSHKACGGANAGNETLHELERDIITTDDSRRLRTGGRTKWIVELGFVHNQNPQANVAYI